MMKEMNLSTKSVPASRIHISNNTLSMSHSAPQYLSFKAQPPRPPCWQDFIGKNLHSTDRLNSNVSITIAGSLETDKKHKSHRSKHKKATSLKSKGISTSSPAFSQAKLKRTQSEPCIAEKEIPVEAQQARLTSERLSKQSIDEAKRYLEDTYRKCSQWLAQISPGTSIPLEDTDFEVGSGDIITCKDETHKDIIDYNVKRHSLALLDKIPE